MRMLIPTVTYLCLCFIKVIVLAPGPDLGACPGSSTVMSSEPLVKAGLTYLM